MSATSLVGAVLGVLTVIVILSRIPVRLMKKQIVDEALKGAGDSRRSLERQMKLVKAYRHAIYLFALLIAASLFAYFTVYSHWLLLFMAGFSAAMAVLLVEDICFWNSVLRKVSTHQQHHPPTEAL